MTFDDEIARALDLFRGRLQEEVARQVRAVGDELAAAARVEAAARSEREARLVAAASTDGTAAARLVVGIRAIGAARSLTDVLDALVQCASEEASRVGLFLVRGDRFRGWRFRGFGPAFEGAAPLEVPSAEAGIIAEAVQTVAMAFTVPGGHHAAPAFAELPAERSAVAVPLTIGGQAIAVLYVDAGQPVNREPGAIPLQPGSVNRESVEILARHAARCLEALTAIKAARTLVGGPEPASAGAERGDEASDEHAAAQRYARLLVSEIKLYHEPEVVAGRRERDLATRLGGEIARARALYEQRVSPHIRLSRDYIREELVRTLADGDPTLLETDARIP